MVQQTEQLTLQIRQQLTQIVKSLAEMRRDGLDNPHIAIPQLKRLNSQALELQRLVRRG